MALTKKTLFKFLKIFGITIIASLLLLIILPFVFADTVTKEVKVLANENLEGKLNFNDSSLSFFKHFPSLTLTLNEFSLNGSIPFQNQSLVNAKEISFGINVYSVFFGSQTQIDKIYLDNAAINIQVNKNGIANYNIYKSKDTAKSTEKSAASLQLKNIQINNSHLVYNDASTKMKIEGKGFNYKGKGDLLKENFNLKTTAEIDSLSFIFDSKEYLKNKKIKADLITKINTSSLSFIFEKNDLIINKLPVEFNGFFDFLSNGYQMDFNLKTENSNLEDLFTALPAEYVTWMNQTKMKGKTDAFFTLKGKYIASLKKSPEVDFNIKVRDGYIKHEKSPYPIENIFLNLDTKLPNLDINQLKIRLDSLYFKVNNNKLSAILKSTGFGKKLQIETKIKSKINLKLLNDALQIPNYKLAGNLDVDLVSKGNYNVDERKFPITKGKFILMNGLIKTPYYPKPIQNLSINSTLDCASESFKSLTIKLSPASFTFENQPFAVNASFTNFDDILYDVKAKGTLNVAKIYKVFSQKGLSVQGFIKADLNLAGKQSDATNGNYQRLKNSGTLELKNIQTTTHYLPKPFLIENGLFTFNQDKMNFANFTGRYGQSKMQMNGYLENVINFVLSKNQTIKGNFSLNSDYLDVNEFMPQNVDLKVEKKQQKVEKVGVVEVPTNLNVIIQANVQKIKYDDLIIDNLKGGLAIQNGSLKLSNGTIGIIGATANMDIFYRNEGSQKAQFEYKILATDFDIKRAYNEIKMFKEIVTSAKSAEGIVSLDYALKGVLNNKMSPVLPSLEGAGILSVKNVKMKGFKLLNVVSKKIESPSIKDPDVSKIEIKSTIKNNLITIERFKIKVAGFRLRFEGQTSLDGKLNLKMRIGLPPLGIIGIPLKITGSQEIPKIKLGRKSEDLEETIYEDGVTPVNIPLIKKDSVNKK